MDNGWEVDEHGRRFRRLGNGVIEHEMVVQIDGLEIPQSELADFNARRKAEAEKRKAESERKFREEQARPKFTCPFSSGMNNSCRREGCALFLDGRCSIAILADAHGTDHPIVKGAKCPFSVYARCDSCALNNGGCAVVRLAAVNK